MIVKTGITVKKENAWEWFNFLDQTTKKGSVFSFRTEPGVMDYFLSLCNKNKFERLGIISEYKSGLVHMFAK